MRICRNCNTVFDNDYPRCTMCGGETVEYSAPHEPMYSAPMYGAPVNTGAKVMSYIGMGHGIFGLAFSIFPLIMFFATLATGRYEYGAIGGMAIFYAILALGGSIAGRILTTKAMQYGCYSSPCTVGNKLSNIGFFINIALAGTTFLVILIKAMVYAF